jgi:hypothetical protein
MPIDPGLAKPKYGDRLDTDNKLEMDNGTYDAVIHDTWVYYVDIDGKFTKNRDDAAGQRIKFTIPIDDSDIALALDLPVRVGKKTFYSSVIESLTGIVDRDAHLAYDPKQLNGLKVEIDVKSEIKDSKRNPGETYWWSTITGIRPRERVKAKPRPRGAAPAPAQQSQETYFENESDEIPF